MPFEIVLRHTRHKNRTHLSEEGLTDRPASEVLSRLYWAERLSIRQTAAAIGMSYQGTRKRLRKLGRIRTKSEGMTRNDRRPFSEDRFVRAYLLGLRAGDINAWKKSPHTIEVRVSTTHPAMSRLFSKAFKSYGHLMQLAEPAYLTGRYRWQVKAHLDPSFAFLIRKPTSVPSDKGEFYRFLAGYSDSECCWSVYPQKNRIRTSWVVETYDARLVRQIKNGLESDGFHPLLYRIRGNRRLVGKDQKAIHGRRTKFRLVLSRAKEVQALAEILMPLSSHAEKISKMSLILSMPHGDWSRLGPKLRSIRKKTEREVRRYTEEAERAYYTRKENRSNAGVVG